MKIKTFAERLITTYKLKVGKYNIMLDFNGKDMTKEDVQDVDIIFISHEHLDHCRNLIDYDLVKNLNSNVRIFTTETTKKLISFSLKNKMNEEDNIKSYNDQKFNTIISLIDKIEIVRFKKEEKLDDDLSFTFYRSGHTFGSAMIYLKSKELTLLYTGDMDYVENDINRQYDYPYGVNVDYVIVDGTNLFDKEFKGVRFSKVREFLKKRKPGNVIYYKARAEKAVLYALALSEKMDNCVFAYTDQMKWYVKTLYDQEYKIFNNGKVLLEREVELDKDYYYKNKVIVKFCNDRKSYDIEDQLSLHITMHDFEKFMNEHFASEPKKILIGHYNFDNNSNTDLLINNSILLKVGENDV